MSKIMCDGQKSTKEYSYMFSLIGLWINELCFEEIAIFLLR